MTYIIYKKDYSASNNNERLPAWQLADFQNVVASKINGGLTDSNFSSSAAIVESKVSFDIVNGHNHDGSNSRNLADTSVIPNNDPHIRSGLAVSKSDNSTVSIDTGHIAVSDVTLEVCSPETIDVSDSSNFLAGSESASTFFFVYIGNTGTVTNPGVDLKLSTETPNLGNVSSGTTERPLRYRIYNTIPYRCIGGIFNDSGSNLVADTACNFDASNHMVGAVKTTGSDVAITTIWTPTFVNAHFFSSSTIQIGTTSDHYHVDANLISNSVSVRLSANNGRDYVSLSTVGAPKTLTTQSTSTAGSVTFHQPGLSNLLFFEIWGLGTRGT